MYHNFQTGISDFQTDISRRKTNFDNESEQYSKEVLAALHVIAKERLASIEPDTNHREDAAPQDTK